MGKTKPAPGRKWILEPAVSGRSRCRKCDNLIDEGTTRVGVLASHQKYDDYYKYYHPECAEKIKGIGFTLSKQARKEINDAKTRQERRVNEFLGQVARGELHVSVTEDGAKMTARKRFGHEDYARLVGQRFVVTKDQMRDESRNGTFTLTIWPGWPNDEVCSDFYCVLMQEPADGRKVPRITFPPESGDKMNLINTEDHLEVSSMSHMLQRSILNSAQTPAVVFDLIDKVAAMDAASDSRIAWHKSQHHDEAQHMKAHEHQGDDCDLCKPHEHDPGSISGSIGPDRMVTGTNGDVSFEEVKTANIIKMREYDELDRINNLDISTPEGQEALKNLCKVGEPGIMPGISNQHDAAFANAGVNAVINHKARTDCNCDTMSLLQQGCQCGALRADREEGDLEAIAAGISNALSGGEVMTLDTETTGQNDLGITGVAFVPEKIVEDTQMSSSRHPKLVWCQCEECKEMNSVDQGTFRVNFGTESAQVGFRQGMTVKDAFILNSSYLGFDPNRNLSYRDNQDNLIGGYETPKAGMTYVASVGMDIERGHVGNPLPAKTEKGLLTAKEALDAVVSTRYQAAAEKIADVKAHVDIAQQSLVPGMKVYHVFRNLPCVLLEETSPGKWTVEDAQGDHHVECNAATLTPQYPGHIKRLQAGIAAGVGRAIVAYQCNEELRETIKCVSLYSLLVMVMAALLLFKFGG